MPEVMYRPLGNRQKPLRYETKRKESKYVTKEKRSEKIFREPPQKNSGNKYISVITLNVNGLNTPIERCRVTEMDTKNKTHLHPAYERFLLDLKTHED